MLISIKIKFKIRKLNCADYQYQSTYGNYTSVKFTNKKAMGQYTGCPKIHGRA
jgi:hypothetical protein